MSIRTVRYDAFRSLTLGSLDVLNLLQLWKHAILQKCGAGFSGADMEENGFFVAIAQGSVLSVINRSPDLRSPTSCLIQCQRKLARYAQFLAKSPIRSY